MADEISDKIEQNAQRPQSVTTDAGTVTQHSLSEQIAADKYLAAKRAARTKRRGIRVSRIVTGGAGD